VSEAGPNLKLLIDTVACPPATGAAAEEELEDEALEDVVLEAEPQAARARAARTAAAMGVRAMLGLRASDEFGSSVIQAAGDFVGSSAHGALPVTIVVARLARALSSSSAGRVITGRSQ
jgi:hypothetical protein